MTGFLTAKQLAEKFPLANLSALPTSNPGGGKPWLRGDGAIGVGAYTPAGVTWNDLAGLLPLDKLPAHTHDDRYARLSGGNSLSGNQAVTGNITASGTLDATAFRQTGTPLQLIPSGGTWFIDGSGGFRYRDVSAAYATRFQVDNLGNVIASGTINDLSISGGWSANSGTFDKTRINTSQSKGVFVQANYANDTDFLFAVSHQGTKNPLEVFRNRVQVNEPLVVTAALNQLSLKGTSVGSAASHLLSFIDSAGTAQAQVYCEGTSRKLSLMNLVTGASTVLGTNGADRLTIAANGDATFTGNVAANGGTFSTSAATMNLTIGAVTAIALSSSGVNARTALQVCHSTFAGPTIVLRDDQNYIGMNADKRLVWSSSTGTQNFFSGAVGLSLARASGTQAAIYTTPTGTTPADLLIGTVIPQHDGTTDSVSAISGRRSGSATEWWSIKNRAMGSGFGWGISINTRDARDPILLHGDSAFPGSARVGVGMTTMPQYTLDVNGTANASAYRVSGQPVLTTTAVGGGLGVSPTISTTDNRDFVLLQPTGGNVLIGTTTHDGSSRLQVNGPVSNRPRSATVAPNVTDIPSGFSVWWHDTVGNGRRYAYNDAGLIYQSPLLKSSIPATPSDLPGVISVLQHWGLCA